MGHLHLKTKRLLKRLFVTSCIVLSILALSLLLYSAIFIKRVLPHTYFSDYSIGAWPAGNVATLVSNSIDSFRQSRITFVAGSRSFDVTPDDLGITYDKQATEKRILDLKLESGFLKSQLYKVG